MISLLVLRQHLQNVPTMPGSVGLPAAPGEPAPAPPAPSPPATSPVEPAPAGDIVTRFGNPPAEVAEAIKRHWPSSQWVNAASVSYLESGWRNTAELNTLNRGPCGTRYWFSDAVGWAQTEDSVGLFQINICAHGGTREHWQDPDNNAAKGAELFASSGWRPWVISAGKLGLL